MNKRPGHVEVFVETGYCSFCDRVRNLRREEHHLGTLVRTVLTCETCHRTLSSTMGVAAEKEAAIEAASPAAAEVDAEAKPKHTRRAAAAKATPAAPKAKAAKSRTTKPR